MPAWTMRSLILRKAGLCIRHLSSTIVIVEDKCRIQSPAFLKINDRIVQAGIRKFSVKHPRERPFRHIQVAHIIIPPAQYMVGSEIGRIEPDGFVYIKFY